MNVLNKFTIKHLKLNKKRTIVTIIGVILSTALMVGIGLLLSTLRDLVIHQTIETTGSQHVTFKDVPTNKYDVVTLNANVKNFFASEEMGYASINSTNPDKVYMKLIKTDANYLKNLKLLEGKLPTNEKEIIISNHLITNAQVDYKIGDMLDIEYGNRMLYGHKLSDTEYYNEEENLEIKDTKMYKIVGIVERNIFESYIDPGYSVFTTGKFSENETLKVYVEYKKPTKTYDHTEYIGKTLGFLTKNELLESITYNSQLLALYGVTTYNNLIIAMASILVIVLTLISIACIIVIYNSFAISVMERKTNFGILSSVGATKKQIRKSVFFEASVVGIMGIPLGILSSYLGIGIVLKIINYLLSDAFGLPLRLTTYPIFLLIPIIFMVIVILTSAFIPARRASKVTPIDLIRQADDIKIKKRKLKTNLLVKAFGIEGEIAYKNMKRNKKKYRITIASLFISIVLFISFSSIMNYALDGSNSYLVLSDVDLVIHYKQEENNETIVKEILNRNDIDDYFEYSNIFYQSSTNLNSSFTEEYKKFFYHSEYIYDEDYNSIELSGINVLILSDTDFDSYLKSAGLKNNKPVLFNKYQTMDYSDNNRKVMNMDRLTTPSPIELCDYQSYNASLEELKCSYTMSDYQLSSHEYIGSSEALYNMNYSILMSESLVKELIMYLDTSNSVRTINVLTKNYNDIARIIREKSDFGLSISVSNIAGENQNLKNVYIVIQILVYGFISLVTLIGVTSVFNTINTSIALRRKEFAMLRSMGLTPKGLNKMLSFETLFVGVKALFLGIPVALVLTVFIHISMNNIVNFNGIMIPLSSILIAIVMVFIIIIISMRYATSKIKKENILEAIRNENI